MIEIKDQKSICEDMNRIQDEYEQLVIIKKKIRPWAEALKIILLYLSLGCAWILLSDKFSERITVDPNLIKMIQLWKGWFYVFVTGLVFYYIIVNRMKKFDLSIDTIMSSYKELYAMHEELIAINEDMDRQNYELEHQKDRLNYIAFYDLLTGLPNRALFEKNVNENILNSMEHNPLKKAIIYLDFDDFKHINNTMGHAMGDTYIQYAANLLSEQIQSPNFITRLGGDEFAIFLTEVVEEQSIHDSIHQLLEQIRKPWMIEGESFFISASIGIAVYPDHGRDYSMLLQNADLALYHRKENGKNGFSIYNQSMYEKSLSFIKMRNQLTDAIDKGEFVLYYQPQIDLHTNKICGVEALIRWKHPQRGFVSPLEFIPFAEKTGQIEKIDEWVINTACEQKFRWEKAGYQPIKMAVNISSRIIMKRNIIPLIQAILSKYNIDPKDLELEITETAVMEELDKASEVLQGFKDIGISVALDDFGTGYSSLTYLQKLPLDILKIDREFLRSVIKEDEDIYIFRTIIELTHNMGLKVISEGVETKEQKLFLMKNHCDMGQGYYFSKPVCTEEIEILLQDNNDC